MTDQQQPSSNAPARLEPAYAAAMPAPQGGALPTGLEWQALDRMAHTLADSDVIPYRLKRKPADVAVILLAAREYGIPPLMALSKLPVVNGTPAPMGELMVALVLRAGHSIRADFRNPDGERYKGGPLTPQHYGEAIVRRRDWPDGVEESLTFTLEEALKAGLIDTIRDGRVIARVTKTKQGNQVEEVTPWEQYTPNMARWRAVANVCRLYFPDVLLGLSYLPEELGAVVDAEGAPIIGEVIDARRQPTHSGSIEERTAQEAADKLAEFVGPIEVLANVEAHARDNGYLMARVTFAGDTMPLESAIDVRREWLKANTVPGTVEPEQPATPAPGTVDADGVEEAHIVEDPPAQETPAEPASAPQEPEQAPAEAPAPPAQGETLEDAAYDVAREALGCADREVLLTLYRGSDDELRAVDVLPVLGDDDLHTLGVPAGTERIVLGALLMAAGKYVTEHGAAIRDPEPEAAFTGPAPEAEGDDPWAGDSTATAAGWAKAQAAGQVDPV